MTRLLPHEERYRWILKVAVFLEQHRVEILSWISTAAAVALTVLAFFDEVHVIWAVILGLIALGAMVFSQVYRQQHGTSIREAECRSDALETDQEEAAKYLREVIHQQVVQLLEETNMVNEHTRVSIYQHDPQRGKFIPVGRVSDNPELEQWGRPDYPDAYGIIREAWTGQRIFKFRLSEDSTEWAAEQNRLYDVPLDVAQNIRMKSRSYIGLRIDYGPHSTKVGIAILESLRPQGVNSGMADSVMSTEAFYKLALALAVGPKPPRTVVTKTQT